MLENVIERNALEVPGDPVILRQRNFVSEPPPRPRGRDDRRAPLALAGQEAYQTMIAPVSRKIGKYEIRHKLGRGGMADVYLATDTERKLPVR